MQQAVKPLDETGGRDLALPDREDAPAEALECASGLGIASHIPGELLHPVLRIGRRCSLAVTTVVPVPEAPVDEDGGTVFR